MLSTIHTIWREYFFSSMFSIHFKFETSDPLIFGRNKFHFKWKHGILFSSTTEKYEVGNCRAIIISVVANIKVWYCCTDFVNYLHQTYWWTACKLFYAKKKEIRKKFFLAKYTLQATQKLYANYIEYQIPTFCYL